MRVALILDRTDLGAVPQLFGHPVQYVKLLSSELYYSWKGALVAVQPAGVGVQNIKPLAPAQALADTIRIESPATADGLALAANETIRKLAGQDDKITFTPDAQPAPAASSLVVVDLQHDERPRRRARRRARAALRRPDGAPPPAARLAPPSGLIVLPTLAAATAMRPRGTARRGPTSSAPSSSRSSRSR